MENQSKYIMIERNKFAALVKAHRKCLQILGIISEAMGHSSIKVTETYLKPFRNKKIDEANNQIIDFVKHSIAGVVS